MFLLLRPVARPRGFGVGGYPNIFSSVLRKSCEGFNLRGLATVNALLYVCILYLYVRLSHKTLRYTYNGILIGTYTHPTHRYKFE